MLGVLYFIYLLIVLHLNQLVFYYPSLSSFYFTNIHHHYLSYTLLINFLLVCELDGRLSVN